MAEFCLECLRELDEISYREDEFILSDGLELCEGCGQYKRVVIAKRPRSIGAFLLYLVEKLRDAYEAKKRADT